MRRVVTGDPHKDCSLCKKLSPPVLITIGEVEEQEEPVHKKQKILSNGKELLFPEKKYDPECIPCYEFHCGHRYHVPCLARLNPNKYTDITFRKDGIRDTLELNEFHCIDCRGTQQINYIFNPDIEGAVNITEPNGTIYINVPDAFEKADTDMATFMDRHLEVVETDLDLHYFIHNGTSRKEMEEMVLPEMRLSVIKFLTLENPSAQFRLASVPLTKEYALINRRTDKPLEMHTVSLEDLLDGIDVHWTETDIERFKTRQMDIKQLNRDYKQDHIERLNRLAAPIKLYLHGDKDARKLIQEDDVTKAMLYGITHPSRNRLCVLNHRGEKKHLVTFDDFPIRETSSCSIMGGTRKRSTRKTKRNRK